MTCLITQRHNVNQYGRPIDVLEGDYIEFFERNGVRLIAIPNLTLDLDYYLQHITFDGIILTGGEDIGAAGESNIPSRDKLEAALIRHAVINDVPLFGICRGMQMINHYFGGEHITDICALDDQKVHVTGKPHFVDVDYDEDAMLNIEKLQVNSYHNCGILAHQLGKGLRSFAVMKELDLVEGLYHTEHAIAGVEWHPERNGSNVEFDTILTEAFKNRKLFWRKRK